MSLPGSIPTVEPNNIKPYNETISALSSLQYCETADGGTRQRRKRTHRMQSLKIENKIKEH
jgi:hypothetical protein